jgi:hypothetical protein
MGKSTSASCVIADHASTHYPPYSLTMMQARPALGMNGPHRAQKIPILRGAEVPGALRAKRMSLQGRSCGKDEGPVLPGEHAIMGSAHHK